MQEYEIEIGNLRDSPYRHLKNEFRVDRQSIVGNPFYMANESMRDDVCNRYEEYFNKQIDINPAFRRYLEEIATALRLYQKVYLYCWCYPKRCHAETIKNWLIENIQGEHK